MKIVFFSFYKFSLFFAKEFVIIRFFLVNCSNFTKKLLTSQKKEVQTR